MLGSEKIQPGRTWLLPDEIDGAHYPTAHLIDNGKRMEKTATMLDILGQDEGLSESDIEKLALWNGAVPRRINRCVHDLIGDRCLEQPNAPAVCAWDGNLTYQELDELSTGLAGRLVRDGSVKAETFVPILFDKSRWTTVAILGVLKSGGAFVLLDQSHPFSRWQSICEDVGATVIVASEQNTVLAKDLAKTVITIGASQEPPRSRNTSFLEEVSVTPNSAAYAVFTSGSTGKPKAAVIEHGAYCTAATAHSQALSLTPTSRVFQFASYAFDVSISDSLMTLIAGACICVPSETDRRNNMSKAARDLQIDRAELTPSVARILRATDIPNLRTLVLGGEAMSEGDVTMWADQVKLINTYGPSECSVNSTIKSPVRVGSDPKNIGYGAGCVCWVVNQYDYQKLVPIGATGELLVEGPIVGRGYLNEPEKTAAAFVHNPPWLRKFRPAEYKGQLYKTGDLVKYEPDGSICYVGRKDTQVKIRGQRVELGEVEHHVGKYFSGARDVLAEVVVPRGPGRSPYLATFILGDMDGDSANEELLHAPSGHFWSIAADARQKLSAKLPPFMVPVVFLPISHVPLTPTGKTDRRKLREEAALLSSSQLTAYAAPPVNKKLPSTDAEEKLHHVLSHVLNLQPETVGINDDFFQIGGDSITAMQLAKAMRNERMELSVADILGHPTLSDMATACKEIQRNKNVEHRFARFSLVDVADFRSFIQGSTSPGSPLNECNVLDILPVTDFQRTCIRDMPCTYLLLDVHGNIDKDRLRAACMTLVQTHSVLRTVFLPYRNSYVQVVLDKVKVPFLRYGAETELHDLVKTFFRNERASIPLGSPLVEFTLVQKTTQTHTLLIQLSHAQFDGLSVPLLYNSLATAYFGEQTKEAFSFMDYTHQCFSYRTTVAFDFWKTLLRGSSMTRLKSINDSHLVSSEHPSIRAIGHLSTTKPPASITMATVVKAAWTFMLAKLTSETDIVFGQLVNGRSSSAPGLESVLGACLNYIPVRVKLQPHWTVLDVLHQVQNQHIQTLAHETTGLSDIVEQCTEWEHGTEFGSTVQYQNIDEHPKISIGGIDYVGAGYMHEERPQCVRILAFPDGDQLEIKLISPSGLMDQDAAQKTVDLLCNCISEFLRDPEGKLSI